MIAEFLAYHTANIDKLSNYQPKIGKARVQFKNKFEIFPAPIQDHPEISVETIEKRYH